MTMTRARILCHAHRIDEFEQYARVGDGDDGVLSVSNDAEIACWYASLYACTIMPKRTKRVSMSQQIVAELPNP